MAGLKVHFQSIFLKIQNKTEINNICITLKVACNGNEVQ